MLEKLSAIFCMVDSSLPPVTLLHENNGQNRSSLSTVEETRNMHMATTAKVSELRILSISKTYIAVSLNVNHVTTRYHSN